MPSSDYADRFWASADGLQLHARDYAAAAGAARLPVVCLHGLTRNARDFEAVAPRLAAQGRRVLALDVRGRGESAWDANPLNYHAGTYVADVLSLLDALGIGQALFVGTSMGGIITMALAAARPTVVAAAVLNDIGPGLSEAGLRRIGTYIGVEADVADWQAAAAYAARINGAAHPDYDADAWERFARRIFTERGGRPVLDYDPAIAQLARLPQDAPVPDLWPLFGALALSRPVLMLRGALSDLMPAEAVALASQASPTVTAVTVPGVGHAPSLSEPEAAAALDAFMQAQP